MEIVHFINDLSANGGAERLVIDLALGSTEDRISVITWRSKNNTLLSEVSSETLTAYTLNPLSITALKSAWQAIRRADICHVHLFPSLYIGALLPGKKIYTEHNTWNRRRDRPILRHIEKIVYGRYDKIFAISDDVRISLQKWLNTNAGKMAVIENGIDLCRFSSSQRTLEPNSARQIGMVGSFSDQKDQDTIVRAMQHLPDHFHVHFAGEGPRMAAVKALATQLGVADRVHFAGLIRDVPTFLQSLHYYVQSAHWEGFGLAAVEAMASGLPTLGSNVKGLADVIGQEAHLFTTGDHRRIAKVISSFEADPASYQTASKNSLRIASQYSIQKTIQIYRDEYLKLTSQ